MTKRLLGIFAAILGAALIAGPAAAEGKKEDAEELVARAAETVAYFTNDSAFEALWETADDAKAIVVVPRAFRAGFIWGASHGAAVMLARKDNGGWSEPTFYGINTASFGLQIGGEMSEIVLLIMTERGVEQLLSSSVKLGGDISIAAGPIGGGAKAQTTDVLAFSRSRGLYGGLSLEGAVVKARHKWNRAYYGADVRPADVIIRENVYSPASAKLQNAVWALAHRNAPAALAPAIRPVDPQQQQNDEPVRYEDDAIYGAPIEEPARDPN
ncbi:MAG: lipid-binding SYLF domain-containing protein [Parvularculaceae bacterium]